MSVLGNEVLETESTTNCLSLVSQVREQLIAGDSHSPKSELLSFGKCLIFLSYFVCLWRYEKIIEVCLRLKLSVFFRNETSCILGGRWIKTG